MTENGYFMDGIRNFMNKYMYTRACQSFVCYQSEVNYEFQCNSYPIKQKARSSATSKGKSLRRFVLKSAVSVSEKKYDPFEA